MQSESEELRRRIYDLEEIVKKGFSAQKGLPIKMFVTEDGYLNITKLEIYFDPFRSNPYILNSDEFAMHVKQVKEKNPEIKLVTSHNFIMKIHPLVARKFVELVGVPDSFKKQVIEWVEDYWEKTYGIRQDHSMSSHEIETKLRLDRIEKVVSRLVEQTSSERGYYDFLTPDNYLKTSKIHDRYDLWRTKVKRPLWTEEDIQELQKKLPGVDLVRRTGSETEIHPELAVVYVRHLQVPEDIQRQAETHARHISFLDRQKLHMFATISGKRRSGISVPSYYTDSSGVDHFFTEGFDVQTVKSSSDARCLAADLKTLNLPEAHFAHEFIYWLQLWADKGATFGVETI